MANKNTSKKYQSLETNIVQAQTKLKEKNPNHFLLNLVNVDDEGIHWTAEFGDRYIGMTAYEGLSKYTKDLSQAKEQN
jgi:hypothetical protein